MVYFVHLKDHHTWQFGVVYTEWEQRLMQCFAQVNEHNTWQLGVMHVGEINH